MAAGHWAARTVLITGGLGFIGSHFVEELLGLGARVLCLYRRDHPEVRAELPVTETLTTRRVDVLDERALRRAADTVPALDMVVNCATLDGNMQFLLQEAGRMLDENMRIVSNVLNLARDRAVPDVVLISSAEIYAYDETRPAREEDDHRRHMEFSPNGYRMSKMFTRGARGPLPHPVRHEHLHAAPHQRVRAARRLRHDDEPCHPQHADAARRRTGRRGLG
ncbi:GDP-L-fucose synthase [Streptomyces glaucescens]